jgi:hypothetical protein
MKKTTPARKGATARRVAKKTATRSQAKSSPATVIRFGLPEQSVTVGVEGPLKLRPAGRALLERLTAAVVKRIERVPEKTTLDLLKQGTDAEMMVSFATTVEAFPELSEVRIDPLAKARARDGPAAGDPGSRRHAHARGGRAGAWPNPAGGQ